MKTNTRKIQKKSIFCPMVDNLMCEVRPNLQIIWTTEQLSAKKKNSGFLKQFIVHVLFWPNLSGLLRAT